MAPLIGSLPGAAAAVAVATAAASPAAPPIPSWAQMDGANQAGVANQTLSGVTCVSATACTAVGSYSSYNARHVLIETWDGTSWSIVPSPDTASGLDVLNAISCSSAMSCVAVGSTSQDLVDETLIEMWDGTVWSVVASPNVADEYNFLYGVSCPVADFCAAVGNSFATSSPTDTLVETWDGTDWTLSSSPDDGSVASSLAGVSCASAQSCAAVGWYDTAPLNGTGVSQTLVESWDGSEWTVAPTPDAGTDANNALTAVTCVTATACTAVGNALGDPLVETESATGWSIADTPSVRGGATPESVSCVSATSCTAVGTSGDNQTFVLTVNGGAWSVAPSPSAPVQSDLLGVACPSTTVCVAVGRQTTSQYQTDNTFGETWNGAGWTISATANQAETDDTDVAISCPTAVFCVAVGSYSGNGAAQTLAESWDGTAWTVMPTPNPGAVDQLTGVSCATVTSCIAVGYWSDLNDPGGRLVEEWNGSAWSVMTGAGAAPGDQLNAVSCSSTTWCVAVGFEPHASTLAETWDGTKWTLYHPGAGNEVDLDSVSCVSAGECTAVGIEATAASIGFQTLIVTWDGTNWTAQPSPDPGTLANQLFGVSCPSATSCVAVGVATDNPQPGTSRTLIEAWDGSQWTVQPSPTSGANPRLQAVSCAPSGRCMAVGETDYFGAASSTLTELWDGTSWSIVPSPPSDSTVSQLPGVACTDSPAAGFSCLAAGNYVDGDSNLNLVARYGTPIVPASTALANQASGSVAAGGSITDTVVLSGGNVPTGTITVDVYGPGDATCSASPAFTTTLAVSGNGAYTSAPYTAATPGTYQFVATYDGDVFNATAGPTACSDAAGTVVVTANHATFTYPIGGQSGVDTTKPFTWSTIPTAQAYLLVIGTHPDGTDLLNSGILAASQSSLAVPDLPAGKTLYAELLTESGGTWTNYQAISFTAAVGHATFSDPQNAEQGVDSTKPLAWTTVSGAQGYIVAIGTRPNATDLLNSGILPPNQSSLAAPDLPAGRTLYAELLTEVGGTWSRYQAITFTAAVGHATFTNPVDGQTNVTNAQPFTWATSPGAQGYIVVLGTTRFGTSLLNSGPLAVGQLSYPMPGFPAHTVVYATILTKVNGAYSRYQAITFTSK